MSKHQLEEQRQELLLASRRFEDAVSAVAWWARRLGVSREKFLTQAGADWDEKDYLVPSKEIYKPL